jgi:hypothetical protein
MKARLYRIIGKGLAIIGIPTLLISIYGVIAAVSYTGEYGPLPSDILILPVFVLLGISMTCSGVIILRRFREVVPFLAKAGEPIHSGSIWKKGSESGLFLTSCERVVSINQESRATAHVGYRIVSAERATCSDCVLREGRAILDRVEHGEKSL